MPGLPALLLFCSLELVGTAPALNSRPAAVNVETDQLTYLREDTSASPQVTNHWENLAPSQSSKYKRSTLGVKGESFPFQSSFPTREASSLIMDLHGLAEANLSLENPNIQVTIEVDPDSQTEFELDLSDSRTDWSDSDWVSQHEQLFWPLFWEYSDLSQEEGLTTGTPAPEIEDYSSQYDWEDNVLSGGEGDRKSLHQTDKTWVSEEKYQYDYEEDEWSTWTPCSATCGTAHQKRTRSCGYSCSATESRICEHTPCTDEHIPENTTKGWVTPTESGTPVPESGQIDSCDRWLSCKSEFLSSYLHRVLTELPSCPCTYPTEAVYSSLTLRDETLARSFRWRDASGGRERLDIYTPGARFCLRSLLSRESSSLGAQHCCYDQSLKLMTRGRAAGIPNLISADFSPELHYKADVLPWILCKGDWSRIHAIRPPNNGRGCLENPSEEEYLLQLQEAREY
ncbi:isthmin-2 isoform X2 [Xenopus laevis]|uniref:Isthmin-2 isoform X2 n=1 Tax=Xenopus laevis TaxID=8355 RepID=A0A8J0THZ1_XENLA|nr:isthmin-2 isoform X2 [Xenopus laevis]